VTRSKLQTLTADDVDEELANTRLPSDAAEDADRGAADAAEREREMAGLEAGMFRQSSVTYAPRAEAATVEDHNLLLLNLLYAREGTPLHSLAKTLARLEQLSHILVWTTQTDYDANEGGPISLDLVQLPRLKLSFQARLGPDGATYLLYSMDHAHLHVSNERQSLVLNLMEGVPHSLLLADASNSYSVLVPSLNVIRPFIFSSPYSTELVVVRSGDRNWYTKLDTRYYLYPVHVSLSFMFTPTLASALYLLLLRFYHRDYADVFRLAGTVGTDMEFTPEEAQIFNKYPFIHDQHPNAHACRARISLFVSDSPVQLGWYTPQVMASLVAAYAHVSISCRLTPSEERRLLYYCHMLEKKMAIVREFVAKGNNADVLAVALKRVAARRSAFGEKVDPPAQTKRQVRAFMAALTTLLRERLDVRVLHDDLTRLLETFDGLAREPMVPYYACLLDNRRAFIEAEAAALVPDGERKPQPATFVVPDIGPELNYLFHRAYDPLATNMLASNAHKNDEGRAIKCSHITDYYYCYTGVRQSNACRCKQCNEVCGSGGQNEGFGCPCTSCERWNKANLATVLELPTRLDHGRSLRQITFYELFGWIGDVFGRHSMYDATKNADRPYLDHERPMSLREEANGFLRYYEMLTGTTKCRVAHSECARDLASLLFHFTYDARRQTSPLGHLMHFLVNTPQCWGRLSKYNRTSKQKNEQRLQAVYSSVLEQAASWVEKTRPDVDGLPSFVAKTSVVRLVAPRPDRRAPDTPLMHTTILPTPRNTDCSHRILGLPDITLLACREGEAAAIAVTAELLATLASAPAAPAVPPGFVKQLDRKEQALPAVAPELPFDLQKHPAAQKRVAQATLERLRHDMADFATDTNETKVPKVVGLEHDAAVRALVADAAAVRAMRAQLRSLGGKLTALRQDDEKFLSFALPVALRTANAVDGKLPVAAGTAGDDTKQRMMSTLLALPR